MNRTAHYGLPLFEATDKPSILVDWNETMAELDNALFTLATGGDTSVVDAITALQQAVASINSQITVINQTLGDTLDTTFMNNIAPQFEATGAEYNPRDMVFHNGNLYICFTQYTGIQDDEEHFDQYFIPVWLANKVTDNLNDVDSLKSRMTSAESGISGLDTRVTALENAPAPSGGATLLDFKAPSSSLSNVYDVSKVYNDAFGTGSVGFTNFSQALASDFETPGYYSFQPNIGVEFVTLPSDAANKKIRFKYRLSLSDDRGASYMLIDQQHYLGTVGTALLEGTTFNVGQIPCPIKIDPAHTSVVAQLLIERLDNANGRTWYSFDTSGATFYNNTIRVRRLNS